MSPVSGPSVTVATSPSRVRSPMMRFSKASGVVTSAVVRTMMSWSLVVSEPAGVSKATEAERARARRRR